MRVSGSRVGVVGGSIAGCAAAIALERLGCEVTVLERSSGVLKDRGSGIAIPLSLRDELIDAGYLAPNYPSCQPQRRHWVHRNEDGGGSLLWDQPSAAALSNWGVLWRSLRARVPDGSYQDGVQVESVRQDEEKASVVFSDGSEKTFDIVIGADGYRSVVRSAVVPDAALSFAGYVLWRGNFAESRLGDRNALDQLDAARAWLTVCFDGGHGVMYPIPDFEDGGDEPGRRRVNWAIYAPRPTGLEVGDPTSIPPGKVSAEHYGELQTLLDTRFPEECRPLFASPQEEVSIQPVYDMLVESYVDGRLVLIGDAGTLTRPHTGSGATKAMQDALCIEELGQRHSDWGDLLDEYNRDRVATGRSVVELGRRLGQAQVEHTPPWANMSAADFETWTTNSLSGESLYFYGADADEQSEKEIG